MYKKILVAILAAAVILISGCDKIVLVKGELSSDETSAEQSSVEPESSEAFISPYPVTVNKVEFDKSPEKVVSLTPAYTEIIFEMGFGDRLVGVCEYCDYPEKVNSLERIEGGAAPDIDRIIGLGADTVITATPIVQKSRIALENSGIKVLVIPVADSLEQLKFIYGLFGVVFAGNDKGQDLAETVYGKTDKAVAKTGACEKISFVYITAALSPAGGNTLESSILSLFGDNIAKDGKGYSFDKSKLLENQPEYIFLSSDFTVEDLYADEVYSKLDAVSEGRVIIIPNSCFERPSGRIADLLYDICEKLPQKTPSQTKPESVSSDISGQSSEETGE